MNALQQLRRCLDGLGRRSTPHYGQLLLLIVLGLALWIGQHRISEGDRAVREAARLSRSLNGGGWSNARSPGWAVTGA